MKINEIVILMLPIIILLILYRADTIVDYITASSMYGLAKMENE